MQFCSSGSDEPSASISQRTGLPEMGQKGKIPFGVVVQTEKTESQLLPEKRGKHRSDGIVAFIGVEVSIHSSHEYQWIDVDMRSK